MKEALLAAREALHTTMINDAGMHDGYYANAIALIESALSEQSDVQKDAERVKVYKACPQHMALPWQKTARAITALQVCPHCEAIAAAQKGATQ